MRYELRNAQNELINTLVLEAVDDWPVPDGHTLVALPDPPMGSPAPLTQLQFLRRFTTAERITIRASSDPVIQDFLHLVNLAQDIRLDDPDTVMGVHYLEQQTLIAVGRADEILAA